MKIKRWRGALVVCLLIGVITAVAVMSTGFCDANADDGASEGVPRIYISLNDVTLEEINDGDKDVKYEGNELTLDDGTATEFDGVRLKGRGNLTWLQEKKSYQIKFRQKVNILGMGESRKWVMLANYFDHSALRTDLAFWLAKIINEGYQLDGRFAELYVEGEYVGLYFVTKSVEIDKNVISLKDPYGILVELDNAHCQEEAFRYYTIMGDCLTVKDVVADDNFEEAFNDFANNFEKFQIAAVNKDYEEIERIVDVDSLIEYYLFSEFIGNLDAYITSFYFYKDGTSDKIHVGPAWDFDGALGNKKWSGVDDDGEIFAPETLEARRELAYEEGSMSMDGVINSVVEDKLVSGSIYELSGTSDFQDLVCRKFRATLLGREREIEQHIYDVADQIRSVAMVNNEKWGLDNFDDSVKYLSNWMMKRYGVFEGMCLPAFDENEA